MYSKAVLKELHAMNEQARKQNKVNKGVSLENKIFISVAIFVMACTVVNLLIYGA